MEEKIKNNNHFNKNKDFYKWVAYILGSIADLFNFFHRVTTSVLAPYFTETFKISSSNLGLMSSTYFYSYAALQPVVGVLTDRWKPRKMLTISVSIMTLGTFIYAYSPNFFFTYLGRLLTGIGSAGIYIPVSWIITKNFAYNKRGLLFAILMFTAQSGSMLGVSPFAKLIGYFGWRDALANIGFTSLALAVLIWLVVRDNNTSNQIKEVDLDDINKKDIIKAEEEKSSWFMVFKEVFSIPVIRSYIIVSTVSYGALMSFRGLWVIPFLMDVYQMERTSASDLATMIPLGIVVGILTLGRFFDTKYGKLLYLSGGMSSLLAYLLFFLFMDKFIGYNFMKILFFIWGFCQGAGPYMQKVYSVTLPKRHYGAALGIVNMFPFLGSALYQSITGLLFDLFGGADALHRSVGSYKLYFLFLTLSLMITTLMTIKVIKILKKDYSGKL